MDKSIGFPYIEVDLERIKENLFEICAKTRKDVSQVIAVVKDNSYGLGAGAISKLLQDNGVKWFAVATIDEAIFLRRHNISENILVLGNTDECDFDIAEKLNITLSIIDKTQIKKIENCLHRKISQNIKWHINIDTGMHRDGILCEDISENAEVMRELNAIKSVITGVYTHFHSSDSEEQAGVSLQQEKFKSAVSALQNAGFNFDIIHTSNSGAISYSDIAENEFIRPGVLLYGCRPDPSRNPEMNIGEAAKICSRISSIRKIKKGEGVSYGHTWLAEKDTQIATISMGYADGFPRATVASHSTVVAHFVVRGLTERFPVVGRITMDYIMLDIGDNTEINVGDEVFLAESIDELALKAGTIGYELLCKFGGLMNRKYISNGNTVGVSRRELF